jgi:hypothetical protein
MAQKAKGVPRILTTWRHLEQIRRLPNSRKKAYKLMAFRGNNKEMQSAAREYARLVAEGFRP